MATFNLSNTAGEIDTGILRAYARIGPTGDYGNEVSIGLLNTGFGSAPVALGILNNPSGAYHMCIGSNNKGEGNYSSSIGFGNRITGGNFNCAIGANNTAGGGLAIGSAAVGCSNLASGDYSMSFGFSNKSYLGSSSFGMQNTNSGTLSAVFGEGIKNTVNYIIEIGNHGGGVRKAGMRLHESGHASISVPIGDTGYGDGGLIAGSEPDGTIFRNGISFKANTAKDKLWVFYNDQSGVIRSGSVNLA